MDMPFGRDVRACAFGARRPTIRCSELLHTELIQLGSFTRAPPTAMVTLPPSESGDRHLT
jgi:hypothetical protein